MATRKMWCMIWLLEAAVFTNAAVTSEFDLQGRSNRYPPTLEIENPVLTSKWIEGSDFVQIIEMVITNNNDQNYLTSADTLVVSADSDFVDLVSSGSLTRLAPHQSAVVQIGVKNKEGIAAGTPCTVNITATYGQTYGSSVTAAATSTGNCGFGDYEASTSSLSNHWNPDWFNDVKFGIFIHWGLYAAPAYGNVSPNEDYAEWYWMRQHDPNYKTKTYQYHLETYGENFNYDDFMSNFTDVAWDPKKWMDLIAASGARYFVPVTKHHDGFALFDFPTNISMRSSIHYGPQRDFIGELLATAKQYYPEIRRGTYFSLPEWYNPAYAEYAITWGGGFPGGPPVNPYTNKTIPYTGYVPVNDFVTDIQLPQMQQLAYQYETELMWCDIGGANNSTIFASEWLNWARDQGRQVTFNNRCGIPGDFDTPEYTTNSGTVSFKWESNRGMDPFSFGFNYQTPLDAYLTGEDIIQSLVDIVSKNGNFLLDIGPMHNGSIPEIMQSGLRDAGSWLETHGDGIYNTRTWSVTPGTGSIRYTTTADAFYIHYMDVPPLTLSISDPIPWLPGDSVTVLGGSQNGTVVPVTHSNGQYNLTLTDEILNGDQYVWSFKLAYTSDW
ncbi:hypothetical protein ZTR_07609 [Talaromyces verruculosus]|nr:hypothetical protein ZTR_07609 [Talaromyces verruculosus]